MSTPHHIAGEATRVLLARLANEIRKAGFSLREVCAQTQDLDIPERIHHPTLSAIFRGAAKKRDTTNKNLYLQQFLALAKILGIPPEALLLGDIGSATVARAWLALDAPARRRINKRIQAELAAVGAPQKHSRAITALISGPDRT